MRPIPATSLGHAHGLLRAIDKRGRLRTDEFVTEFSLEELFPPDLENALGRLRHFVSYGRAAGLVKEDRGVVELTEVGRRYIRAGDADAPFEISSQQAEWLRRQLREKHMTDSIFHGLAIGLSLLASCPPPSRVSTMDFGRSMAYLGRAGWDNDNTLLIQGERHLLLLQDMELIDGEHRLTPAGDQLRSELTLPVHMGLVDIAAQLNPGGADAVRAAAEEEWSTPEPAAPAEAEPERGHRLSDRRQLGGRGRGVVATADRPARERSAVRLGSEQGFADDETIVTPNPVRSTPPLAPPPARSVSVEPPAPDAAAPAPVEPPVIDYSRPARVESPPVESAPPPVPVEASPPPVEPTPPPVSPPVESAPPRVSPAPVESASPPASPTPEEAAPPPVEPPPVSAAPVEPSPPVSPASVEPPPASPAPVESAPPPVSPPLVESPPPVSPAPPVMPRPVDPSPSPVMPAPVASSPAEGAGAPRGSAPPVGPPRPNLTMMQPVRIPTAAPSFVEAGTIRAAAEAAGLRLPEGVYANVAAALNAGKHLLLTGGPGSGKTWLALAVARAAAQAGKARGATVVTGAPNRELIVDAASKGRWVIVDELDQADPDDALSPLSTFLAGVPVTLDGEEAAPADGWRLIGTWNGEPPRAAILRRFALVEVLPPEPGDLNRLLNQAASGDQAAVAAAERLAETGLGTAVLLDAARHAAARNAAAPTDEPTLAREVFAAYAAPLADP